MSGAADAPRSWEAIVTFTFSRRLALVIGVLLPILETIQRWPQLGDLRIWPAWLDDFLIAAFLLYAVRRTSIEGEGGRPYLTLAWGVALGMAYNSFFGQLMRLDQPDPAPIPAVWVVTIKGIGMLLIIAGLIGSLRSGPAPIAVPAPERSH
jgi:hypothetical protein